MHFWDLFARGPSGGLTANWTARMEDVCAYT